MSANTTDNSCSEAIPVPGYMVTHTFRTRLRSCAWPFAACFVITACTSSSIAASSFIESAAFFVEAGAAELSFGAGTARAGDRGVDVDRPGATLAGTNLGLGGSSELVRIRAFFGVGAGVTDGCELATLADCVGWLDSVHAKQHPFRRRNHAFEHIKYRKNAFDGTVCENE